MKLKLLLFTMRSRVTVKINVKLVTLPYELAEWQDCVYIFDRIIERVYFHYITSMQMQCSIINKPCFHNTYLTH